MNEARSEPRRGARADERSDATGRDDSRPTVVARRFRRRDILSDPNFIDLGFEYHFGTSGTPPGIRVSDVDWGDVFGDVKPLRVEIGFGKSDFLLRVAQDEPEFNYVGFEYSSKRVAAFLAKARRHGVSNVRAVCCNMTNILDRVFTPGSVDRFFVLFPDPWPKRRHAKNRFVQPATIRTVLKLLRPAGGLTLRTDAPAYAAQMLDVLDAEGGLVNLAGTGNYAPAPREIHRTLYEEKFVAMGRRIYYLEYAKCSPAGP